MRVPLNNRLVGGIEGEWRRGQSLGVTPDEYLLVADFQPCGFREYEKYKRKGDKMTSRYRLPGSTWALANAVDRQNIAFGSVYGQEHLGGRTDALAFLRDLYIPYDIALNPTFLTHVWGGERWYTGITLPCPMNWRGRPPPCPNHPRWSG